MAKGDSGSGKYKYINLNRKTSASKRSLPKFNDFDTSDIPF